MIKRTNPFTPGQEYEIHSDSQAKPIATIYLAEEEQEHVFVFRDLSFLLSLQDVPYSNMPVLRVPKGQFLSDGVGIAGYVREFPRHGSYTCRNKQERDVVDLVRISDNARSDKEWREFRKSLSLKAGGLGQLT